MFLFLAQIKSYKLLLFVEDLDDKIDMSNLIVWEAF